MAEFKPFDYGKAVGQGQQNALRSAQMMQVADKFQGQNALNQMAQEGVGGADKYNALMQQGRPDLARQEQAKDLQMESAKIKFMGDSSRRVYDQASYDAWDSLMVQTGSAQPGEIKAQFGESYDDGLNIQKGLKAFRGDVKDKLGKVQAIDMPSRSQPGSFERTLYQDGQPLETSQPFVKKNISEVTNYEGDLSKKTADKAQLELKKSLEVKDKLTNNVNFIMKNQDLFDVGSRIKAGTGNLIEYLGADSPEYFKKDLGKVTTLDALNKKLANAIRIEATGASASFKELDKFIYPMVPTEADGKTKAIKKMQALVMFNELKTVRLKSLLQDGFKVASKKGDRTMMIITPEGKRIPVEKLNPLSSMPNFQQRKGQLLQELAQGRNPEDFSKQEIQSMLEETLFVMQNEGYNTDVSRAGWNN